MTLLTSNAKNDIISLMRTTLSLDDDLLPHVKTYAASRDISVGKAVSDLVRRGLQAPLQTRLVNGFCVVDLPAGSAPVTAERVRKLEEDLG
jgi:hypothetical protein